MIRTILFLGFCIIAATGISQPTLNFTALSLSGPALVQPVDITGCGDGSGRLFIVEKRGTIRIVENNAVLPAFFLDIQTLVMNSGERGLLGLAFHPSYPASPYIYVNYVITGTITNKISRFTLNPNNANDIDESTELQLITQTGVETNHKAGDLAFGPDGYLYIGMGDGGGGGDPSNTGQNNETLLGKILRIDVNATQPPLNYAIPPDNPFVGIAGLDEIWAKGVRNPWRISFDRSLGDLWIGDVGQNQWEEVDMVPYGTPGGINFGWDCKEGNHDHQPNNCPGNTVFTWPVFEYPHTCNPCPLGYGASLTGGFVYRGSDYPVLQGCYVCADYVSNYLWMVRQTATDPPAFDVYVQNGAGIVSGLVTFGEDDDGELYASNLSGVLYSVSATGTLPILWESVKATIVTGGNKIEWSIHQDIGLDVFDVHRSLRPDFENFTTITTIIPVAGKISYQHIDAYTQQQAVYYRIAARMQDGSTEYSPIRRVLAESGSTPSLIFDATDNAWRINLPGPWRNGEVTVYDVQGKEVYARILSNDQFVDLTTPPVAGSYVVEIRGEMGTWAEKVVW